MRLDDLDYDLPADLIAQAPPARREDARLLVLERATGERAHGTVTDLARHLRAGDLLVVNDTRVLPARLFGRRDTGGRLEILLLEPDPSRAGAWTCLARAGGTLREDETVRVGEDGDRLRLVRDAGHGHWVVEGVEANVPALMRRHGHMPLPPYIQRGERDPREDEDRRRYQTVYAKHDGAVAAPTAGLHLTDALLKKLAVGGVGLATVTLHVGLGTFEPVRTEVLEEHPMHEEAFAIPRATADAVRATRARGGRVVAVGTTSVRALEAAAQGTADGVPLSGARRTDLLIAPGFPFRVVDALLTNFHLPRSTLLALIAAFAGLDAMRDAYRDAVASAFRFYSYGDAMLIL